MKRLTRNRRLLPVALLVLVQLASRIRVYLNPDSVNSDAAIIGLQARHILLGEWSWFVWGANYQASFESLLTAGAFFVFGATPLALTLMPLLGHLLMLLLVYDVLCKRLEPGLAWILVLALSWMPSCIEWSYSPPRQWSMTAFMAAIWLLDSAAESRRPPLRHAAAALLGVLSMYLDLYTLQLMVGFCLFAVLCAFDAGAPRAAASRRIGAFSIAAATATLLLLAAWQGSDPSEGKSALRLARIQVNARLLIETCLPRLVGAKSFIQGGNLLPDVWEAPLGFRVVQIAGALLFLGGFLSGGLLCLQRRIPWPLRRLGALGFVVGASSLAGFFVSIMPSDLWTTRYLAPVTVFAPFTLAPVASLLGRGRTALGLLPYLVATLTSTWLLLGPRVQGLLAPVDPSSSGREALELCDALRRLGIRHGAAQYWLAYRLTFLCEEDPVVVTLAPIEDRYPPYRRDYLRAPVVALIFHPLAPKAKPAEVEVQLRDRGATWERREIAGYTVLIWRRVPAQGTSAARDEAVDPAPRHSGSP